MTDEEKNDSEFDWAEAAQTVGASEKQVSFCQAVLSGASNTAAARSAGYAGQAGQLRSASYAVSRSGKVQALLSLARAGGAGVMDDLLTDDEARRILSRMARQGDPQAKVRAITALERMAARTAGDGFADWTPDVTARRLCEAGGAGGALAAASVFYKVHKTLWGLPLGDKILPVIARDFPEALRNFIDGLPAGKEHHERDIQRLASGPIGAIGGYTPEGAEIANGSTQTNGTALQVPEGENVASTGMTFNSEQQTWGEN